MTPELVASGGVDAAGVVGWLDIRFRMLTPRELARAMGFQDSYQFAGTRQDMVRQIGNAVAVGQATALCAAALDSMGYRTIRDEAA